MFIRTTISFVTNGRRYYQLDGLYATIRCRDCHAEQDVKAFDTEHGTSGLRNHSRSHKTTDAELGAVRIPMVMRRKVADAAAEAAVLGILTIFFTYRQPGMLEFASSLVDIGKSLKPTSRVNVMELLSYPPTIRYAI